MLSKIYKKNFSLSSALRMPVRSKRPMRRSSPDEIFYEIPKGKIVNAVPTLRNYSINKKMIQSSELSNDDEANNN